MASRYRYVVACGSAQRFAAAPGSGERWIPTARSSPRSPRTSTDRSRPSCWPTRTGSIRSPCACSAIRATPRKPPRTPSSVPTGRWPGTTRHGSASSGSGRGWRRSCSTCAARGSTRRPANARRSVSLDGPLPGDLEPSRRTRRTDRSPRARRRAAAADWAELLLTLPPAYRSAVVLRHVDGLSLPGARHRPRSTRGHRQGPGPPRPGPVAHGVRGRPAARARGDDRMTTDDRDLEAAMAGLSTTRPGHARPERPRRGRAGRPLRPVRLPDRAAGRGLERAGRLRRRGGLRRRRVRGAPPGPDGPAAPSAPSGCRRRLATAIARRLGGDRRVRIDLDLRGHTDFERDVWHKALEIPRGEVRPYGWIAAEIGRPKAVRAVGTALGHNPVPLIVPCHRVVRTDGTIGQYSLGGPEQQADDPRGRGPRPRRRWSSWHRRGVRFIGSDTTKIFCLPTCRHARRVTDRHRLEFHSMAEGQARGYRACLVCRPASAYAA